MLSLLLVPFLLAGCGASGPAALILTLALSLGAVAACSGRSLPGSGSVPPGEEPGGTYERCCEDGRITSCYCPPTTSCNYGWGLIDCGDGTCYNDGEAGSCGTVDGGPPSEPDAEMGTYEQCCENGRVTTCYCPPMAACNYGWGLNICDDGTCRYDSACPGVDGGIPDGGPTDGGIDVMQPDTAVGGTYEQCCENGRLTTCYCPPETACNYGLGLVDCGDGSCVYEQDGQSCPGTVDGGSPDV
jgi:hypothetical protein